MTEQRRNEQPRTPMEGAVRRQPPRDMPRNVPPSDRVPPRQAPPRQATPSQKPIDDDAPSVAEVPRWRTIVKKVATVLLVLLALALAYVFLLLGEPDEEATQSAAPPAEVIRVPIQAVEITDKQQLGQLAASFSEPVLTLEELLPLSKATLFDSAYQNGYARRLSLLYTMEDGSLLQLDSIRPDGAVTLFEGRYTQRVDEPYSFAGMSAQRLDAGDHSLFLTRAGGVCYAVSVPASQLQQARELLKYCVLMQAADAATTY